MILELLNEAFPDGVKLPKSFYHARKITRDLGFTYETWDAFSNHCMLFKKEVGSLDKCLICGTSRYKETGISNHVAVGGVKRIAAQQVRYFPLKPWLQRLFMSSKTAKHMRWHVEERINDGVFRHPADSLAWKDFDERHITFSGDTRNIRLGLASDGFNPFRTMSIFHSTWPVVLIPYNLPPWMCLKQPFLIFSMLIDGPNGPLDKIDVYMQPLIDELKELWEEGIATFDASRNQMFQLRAALLWTINDFPAYANLPGWSTKGQFACPTCNINPSSRWLKNCGKFAYLGSRRYLPRNHKFRKDKVSFDGTRKWRGKPEALSGTDLLSQMEANGILTEYKIDDLMEKKRMEGIKKAQCRKCKRQAENANEEQKTHSWKKKSIFYELSYWEHNLIRHNLDVMHIEKNICDNILGTILGLKTTKNKDTWKARLEMTEWNIRAPLHPEEKRAQ